MINGSRQSAKLVLCDKVGLGRLQVELEAFFDFSFSLAEDLEDLVGKWRHIAAPKEIEQQRTRKSVPR
jgi:hypothetical protein